MPREQSAWLHGAAELVLQPERCWGMSGAWRGNGCTVWCGDISETYRGGKEEEAALLSEAGAERSVTGGESEENEAKISSGWKKPIPWGVVLCCALLDTPWPWGPCALTGEDVSFDRVAEQGEVMELGALHLICKVMGWVYKWKMSSVASWCQECELFCSHSKSIAGVVLSQIHIWRWYTWRAPCWNVVSH